MPCSRCKMAPPMLGLLNIVTKQKSFFFLSVYEQFAGKPCKMTWNLLQITQTSTTPSSSVFLLPSFKNFLSWLRASTLLHVSSLIARLMQCHVGFLVMWKREREVRERGCCFARQPPHKLNFRIMIQLDHHCTSFSCHATYNVPFLFIQIKELKSFYETTYKTTINCLISRLKITCHAWDYLLDNINVLALRTERRRWESSTKSLIFRISKNFSSNN